MRHLLTLNLTRNYGSILVWYVTVFYDASVVCKSNLGLDNFTYMVYEGFGFWNLSVSILDRTCIHLYQVVIRMEQKIVWKCLQESTKLQVFTVALVEFIGLISS